MTTVARIPHARLIHEIAHTLSHTRAITAVASNSRFTVLIKSDDGFYALARVRASVCLCVRVFGCGSVLRRGYAGRLTSGMHVCVYLNSFKLL